MNKSPCEHTWYYNHYEHKAYCNKCSQGSSAEYYNKFPLR